VGEERVEGLSTSTSPRVDSPRPSRGTASLVYRFVSHAFGYGSASDLDPGVEEIPVR